MLKMISRCCIVIMMLLLLGVADSQQQQHFSLLELGMYHGDELALVQPADWLAVSCKDSKCEANPVQVKTRREHDDVVDEDNYRKKTGVGVYLQSKLKPLFLVRGVQMNARPVPTFFASNVAIPLDKPLTFDGVTNGVLQVEGERDKDGLLTTGNRLVLIEQGVRQVLYTVPAEYNEPHVSVLWVGDIDGDGKPDLLVDTSWHYNVSHKVLWLSSLATKGKLVGKAAERKTIGC